jgi:hypothetical protein
MGRVSWCHSCIALAVNNSTMGFSYVSSHRGIKAGKAHLSHGRDEIYKRLLTHPTNMRHDVSLPPLPYPVILSILPLVVGRDKLENPPERVFHESIAPSSIPRPSHPAIPGWAVTEKRSTAFMSGYTAAGACVRFPSQ